MSKTRFPKSVKVNESVAVPVKPVDENVFASPWKKSDVVLEVEGTCFHVHRSILSMQSPVFDAMLDGQFREAKQEKITLKGKTPEDMLQFLKLFYPENMIKKPMISFSESAVFNVLRLADEYQAEDVMNECLSKIEITTTNVFTIFPYANKYDQSVRKKCVDKVAKSMSIKRLQRKFPVLESNFIQELLVAKCKYLEPQCKIRSSSSEMSDSD